MKRAFVFLESIVYILLFQTAFRWPGIFGGALEATAVVLLPMLLVLAMHRGRRWWAVWIPLFAGVMLLTIWMPPTIASKGGIPTWLSWFAGLLLWAYDSLPPLLALLAARFFWKKLPGWRGAAAAACSAALIMVACDTWLLHIYPWTWAAALASPPLLGRAAAFLGTEGFTAVVWITAILAGCFLARGEIKKTVVSLASALAFLLALSSAWHLLPRGPELALDVAIVQPNYPVNTHIPNQLADMWRRSDALLQKDGLPGKDRPTLLLWPESGVTDGNYLLPDLDFLANLAVGRNVAWLFGTYGWFDRNSLQNIVRGEAAGQRPFLQAKVVPMPFGERMPGPRWMREMLENMTGIISWMPGELSRDSTFAVPSQTGAVKIHPLICSEALIPSRVRSGLIIADGDLLTEHTNDAWFETSIAADLHASMVRLRALETGLPVVRATMSGRSGLVREDGAWQHFSGSMTEGAWSFELKWRPIHAPARTSWPFCSLLFLLIAGTGLFGWPAAKREKGE